MPSRAQAVTNSSLGSSSRSNLPRGHHRKEDHYHNDGTLDERDRTSRDRSPFYKTNLWASGAMVLKDKLFFFAMYERRDTSATDVDYQ